MLEALLADAEVGEDGVESLLGGDLAFAGDFGEVGEDEAEVLGYQVAAELLLQTREDAREIVMGVDQRLVVTRGGDDDVGLGQGGEAGGFVDGCFQDVEVDAVLGAEGNDGEG